MTDLLPNLIDAPTLLQSAFAPVFLDATLTLDPSRPSGAQRYSESHIQGAHYFDLNQICDAQSNLPRMLPSVAVLRAAIRRFGIHATQPVVVYDQDGLYSAPRVWWMLRCLGHARVAVLDGGLRAWIQAGGATQSGAPTPLSEVALQESARPSGYVYPKQRLIDRAGVRDALQDPSCAVLDARSRARFLGEVPERSPHLRSGHMPGSFSLPYTELVTQEGCLVPKEVLRAKLDALNFTQPPARWVSSCGSGITACVFALAMEHYWSTIVQVYDGSWSEWGRDERQVDGDLPS